jgi:transposase
MWTKITRPKYERKGSGYSSDLGAVEWALIEPRLPKRKRLGRPPKTEMRMVVNAVLYMVRTGCQWRQLPKDFPPASTVQHSFYRWRDSGVRHAKAALSLRVNKTDANAAHGIGQIVRVGWYREVVVKSMDNHALRAMLGARAHLVAQSVTLANAIRGLLKVFGLVIRRAKGGRFEDLVRAALAGRPASVAAIIEPLLAVLITTRAQLARYERILHCDGARGQIRLLGG